MIRCQKQFSAFHVIKFKQFHLKHAEIDKFITQNPDNSWSSCFRQMVKRSHWILENFVTLPVSTLSYSQNSLFIWKKGQKYFFLFRFITVNLLCSFAFEVKTSFAMQSKELVGLKDLLVVSSFLYGQLC